MEFYLKEVKRIQNKTFQTNKAKFSLQLCKNNDPRLPLIFDANYQRRVQSLPEASSTASSLDINDLPHCYGRFPAKTVFLVASI
ncbi:hypothetical protein TNCT_586631 [Trichonephila clavata]|uniref:Uncharacterized protein n=1 Tax=Trichonephila clavata TaxID=2740835 RepID=A0A8X6L6Z2_TRICU|nr:hypothetical protein TNCT_586631 [Trichonephila clavata]